MSPGERERERKRGAEELSDPFFVSLLKYRERERKWFKEPLGWQSSEPIGWVDPPSFLFRDEHQLKYIIGLSSLSLY